MSNNGIFCRKDQFIYRERGSFKMAYVMVPLIIKDVFYSCDSYNIEVISFDQHPTGGLHHLMGILLFRNCTLEAIT